MYAEIETGWWKQAKVTSRVNRRWNLRKYEIFSFLYCWGIYSVQIARGLQAARASGKGGPEVSTLCVTKGRRTCGACQGTGSSETWREPTIPSLDALRLSRDKSPGFPLFVVPPRRHQLELLFCYLAIAPRLNYFKDGDVWDSAIGILGTSRQGGKETWSVLSVGCVAVKGLRSQLRWCMCDCQGASWMVGQESFLNIYLTLRRPLDNDDDDWWWWWWDLSFLQV